MLRLSDQAEAILARVHNQMNINQAEYLDTIEDFDHRPVRLPSVSLVLGEVRSGGAENNTATLRVAWLVLVTAKNLTGSVGLLAITDGVLGALSGFQPMAGTRPMVPEKIEFLDRGGEASTYVITFITLQRAPMVWAASKT